MQETWRHCIIDWQNGRDPAPYIPFEAAEAIHKSRARVVIIAAGNRFAKSTIAAMEAVDHMVSCSAYIWLCAPQLRLATQGEWPYIEQAIMDSSLWPDVIKPKIKRLLIAKGTWDDDPEKQKEQYDKITQKRYIRITRGKSRSLTILWPGKPHSVLETVSYGNRSGWDKLEAVKLSMIIFSEGSHVPLEVWERHLRKRGADRSMRIMIPCTPKGRDEFLYPAYIKGLSKKIKVDIDWNHELVTYNYQIVKKSPFHVDNAVTYMESYETFHHAAFENPYFNMAEYEADKAALFDRRVDEVTFLERNFGCFVSFSGAFYQGLDFDKCCVLSQDAPVPEDATIYVTIDPGRATYASIHWIAVCKPDDAGISKWIIFDEIYQKGMYNPKTAKVILERNKKCGRRVALYVVDRTERRKTHRAEDSSQEELRDLGLNPITSPWKMPTTIEALRKWRPMLQKAQILIHKDKCPEIVNEMHGLEYAPPTVQQGKTIHIEKVVGNQHALDGVTYAVYCYISWRDLDGEDRAREDRRIKAKPIHKDSPLYALRKEAREDTIEYKMGTF